MNIVFLTENFPPETNAAATRVFERACYWANWGHQVTILTSAPNFPHGKVFFGYQNRWRQVEEMSGLRVVRVKTYLAANRGKLRRTLDFISFMASAFWAGLFEQKPDLIVATSPQFFAAVGAWALAAVRRKPFVFELGDLWPASIVAVGAMADSPLIRGLEKLELFLYRRATTIVALTHSFKANLIRRRIAADKIAVIINGVDLWRYGPRPRDAQLTHHWGLAKRFVVGYVGTHGMAHGLSNVLDAAEKLRDRPEITFLLVGSGAERKQLITDAQTRELSNVVFMEPQPKEKMPEVWSLCDVALVHLRDSPVFRDVIPSKIFEAMGMGLPVLMAAPAGEASIMLEAAGAGLSVAPEDPEALALAVALLHDDPALRQTLATQSLAAAPDHSREQQARHMIEILEAVVAGHGGNVGRITPPSAKTL